jgi:protein arginine N-methyltransferase 5
LPSACVVTGTTRVLLVLLISFGDNSLSSDFVDGAQRYLKADRISIPYSYTSFVCPVQSPRIFSELLYNRDANKPYYASEIL